MKRKSKIPRTKLSKTPSLFLIFCVPIFCLLQSCSTGPGAPTIRKTSSDGDGKLIAGCSNVSRSYNAVEFNTRSYLTTWFSAIREGSAQGLYEGLQDSKSGLSDEEIHNLAFNSLPEPEIYCRSYSADPETIYGIAKGILPEFEYSWEYLNPNEGLLRTDYAHRSSSSAKWKDRYFIDIKSMGTTYSIVRLHRDILISRRTKGDWSGYIKATSVGYNEAVILNLIDQGLQR